jgi:hypothetical protein
MGAPNIPIPPPPPPAPDLAEAAMKKASYNASQKALNASRGRAGSFLTAGAPAAAAPATPVVPKTLLGQ